MPEKRKRKKRNEKILKREKKLRVGIIEYILSKFSQISFPFELNPG